MAQFVSDKYDDENTMVTFYGGTVATDDGVLIAFKHAGEAVRYHPLSKDEAIALMEWLSEATK